MMDVKKFLKQECIGHSADYRRSYWRHVVLLNDGTQKVAYNYYTNRGGAGGTSESFLTEERPFVAIPINKK